MRMVQDNRMMQDMQFCQEGEPGTSNVGLCKVVINCTILLWQISISFMVGEYEKPELPTLTCHPRQALLGLEGPVQDWAAQAPEALAQISLLSETHPQQSPGCFSASGES